VPLLSGMRFKHILPEDMASLLAYIKDEEPLPMETNIGHKLKIWNKSVPCLAAFPPACLLLLSHLLARLL